MLRFGTDGVRGLANEELRPELVVALGRSAARVLALGGAPANELPQGRPCFVVGRDTRRSSPFLQAALSAGLASEGVEVIDVGVLPTPGVAYVSVEKGAPAAVISASHNPYWDNGIKFFTAGGSKLADEVEQALESQLDVVLAANRASSPPVPTGAAVGGFVTDAGAAGRYERHLLECLEGRRLRGPEAGGRLRQRSCLRGGPKAHASRWRRAGRRARGPA